MAKTKALPAEHREAVRRFAKAIVDEDFGGNVSRAARGLGISQSMLHEVMVGESRTAGVSTLIALADYRKVTLDVVLGRSAAREPPLCQHPDWPAARAAAAELHPEIPPTLLDLMGQGWIPGGAPEHIDGTFVAGLAQQVMAQTARNAARKLRAV